MSVKSSVRQSSLFPNFSMRAFRFFGLSVGDIVKFVRAKEKAKKDWIFTRYVIGSYNEDCQTSKKGQICQSFSRKNTIV